MRAQLASLFKSRKSYLVVAGGAVIIYLALAVGSALTYRPEIDEGSFASPALNLVTKGLMGTTVLETAGSGLKNIDQHTYWVMPLHLLAQAGWYKIFGFSLLSMRTLSTFFGLIALASLFIVVNALSGDRDVALLTLVLLSVDYVFIVAASLGRMDMMSASLGFAALAAYVSLRERNLVWAIVASQSLVVASGLTHPNGILHFAGLLFLTLYLDRGRINWRHVMLAMIPYLIGAVCWGLYILKDPSSFITQFTINTTMNDRMGGFKAPWIAFVNEFTLRYGRAFGLGTHSTGHTGPIFLKSLILLAYAVALFGALITRSIRQHAGYRALLFLIAIYFVLLTILDGQKETPYLIHIIPFYAAILAAWIRWCWTNRSVPVSVIALCFVSLLTLQIGGILYRMKLNTYRNLYLPAVSFLNQHSNPSTRIIGAASLDFGLNFPDDLVDDVRLGYVSGKRPDFIVVGDEYEVSYKEYQIKQPELYRYLNGLLTEEYRLVYDNPAFKIYARR